MSQDTGHGRPTGERRRRREAERAAALAAQQTGASRPLTRRELRNQQAEEAARLEAIATGELRLDLPSSSPAPERPAQPEPAQPEPAPRPQPPAEPEPQPQPRIVPSAPQPWAARPQPEQVRTHQEPARPAPATPTRRSMRERLQDPPTPDVESPQERTATGRRPVVRTPSSAQGVRSLDATGQLTGIQPVVRPDQPVSPWQPLATPADRAAAALPPIAPAPAPALPDPAPTAAQDDDEDDDLFAMRPQWLAIDSIGTRAEHALSPVLTRRSLRERTLTDQSAPDPQPEPADDGEAERSNPAVAVIKVLVLVLVAAIIGALIWLLAEEAFGDDPSTASPTIVVTNQEETRVR